MEKENKGFALSTLAVNNRKTVFLIAAIIFLAGFTAYQSMPKENFPELQIPEIYVGIAKPGSSPKYMAEKIAKSIEKEIGGIKLLDEIKTNAVSGYVTIQVKFDFKMSVDKALQKVKDAVDKARTKSDFPDLPIEPNIFEVDPSQMPIMNVNLRGNNAALLKEVAEAIHAGEISLGIGVDWLEAETGRSISRAGLKKHTDKVYGRLGNKS